VWQPYLNSDRAVRLPDKTESELWSSYLAFHCPMSQVLYLGTMT